MLYEVITDWSFQNPHIRERRLYLQCSNHALQREDYPFEGQEGNTEYYQGREIRIIISASCLSQGQGTEHIV